MTKGSVFSTTHSFSKGKLLILACFVHRQVKMPWQGTRTSILGRRTLRSWAMTLFPLRATWASVLGPVPPGILSLPFFTINLIQPWFVINQSHFHFSHYPPTCSLDEGENLVECSQPWCTSLSWFFSPWFSMIEHVKCWFVPTLQSYFKHDSRRPHWQNWESPCGLRVSELNCVPYWMKKILFSNKYNTVVLIVLFSSLQESFLIET